ncbi:MAG: hypothetical protein LUE93_14220 [Bacteroides sp.]|nr:hypothetical protein [Bacteroides sp.]
MNDKNIYLGVKMSKGARHRYAIIQMPVNSVSPCFIVLPSGGEKKNIIFY